MTTVNTEKNIPLRKIITATFGIGLAFSLPNSSPAQAAQKVNSTAMTAAHNQWRSKTGVTALTWSNNLAASAQQWADQLAQNGCKMQHGATTNGENIYWAGAAQKTDGTSSAQEITSQNVVDSWGNEIKYYDYDNNACHSVCGHYTQVVWQSTTKVGCGMATCNDNEQIWVCQYNPRGNIVGQKPYSLTKEEPSPTRAAATKTVKKTSIVNNNSSLDQKAMITAHNKWRSKVGVPNLTWSNELARSSQEWVDHLAKTSCTQGHSGGNHGENIYQAGPVRRSDGSSRMQNITAQDVVNAWGNEINDYDYSDNSCHSVCGHYTQVVWETTREVGCAMAVCGDKTQLWACQYSPTGNMVGQKPY